MCVGGGGGGGAKTLFPFTLFPAPTRQHVQWIKERGQKEYIDEQNTTQKTRDEATPKPNKTTV